MTNRFTTLAAAAALFLGVAGQARAAADDMTPYATVGHWQIKADAVLCTAHGEYQDGTYLDVSINAYGVATISMVDPKWNIPKGTYSVTSWIDRAPTETFTAKAEGIWVGWHLGLNEENINLLSYGNVLHVQIGSQTYNYKLDRSEAMLKALSKCAAPRIAAANPFAGSPPAAASKTPASTETPSNPFRRL
jgi:hypothetical protein